MNEIIDKLRNNINKIILFSFIAILIWIVSNSILYYDKIIYFFNPILLIIGTCIYVFIVTFAYKKIIPKLSEKKIIPYILIGIFFVLSLLIGYILRLNPTWDMGVVYKIAKSQALTGTLDGSTYLMSYPNNIMIAVIYTIVFKVVSFFGVSEFITTATIFNAIVITLTVWITYKIADILFDNKKALMLLFIMVLTTPLYLHVAIYYTDSLSMLFSTLIFYMFLIIEKMEKNKKKIFLQILLGVIIIIAWKVKITSIFIFIAICVYYVLNGIKKKDIKGISFILISSVIFLIIYNFSIEIKITNREDVNNYKMPIEYWILTGLNGKGVFKEEYHNYFVECSTYSERKEVGKQKIIETIESYSVNDFVKHLTDKLKYAWADGTYFAPEKLRREPVNYNIIHDFVLAKGKYSSYYKYFPQTMHIGMLIFMIFSTIKMLRKKEFNSKKMILVISICGLMCFLLIWENRSRYILTMLPLYLLLAVDGIDSIEINSRKKRKQLNEYKREN